MSARAETDPLQSLLSLDAGDCADIIAVLIPDDGGGSSGNVDSSRRWRALPVRVLETNGDITERDVTRGLRLIEGSRLQDIQGPTRRQLAGSVVRLRIFADTHEQAVWSMETEDGRSVELSIRYRSPLAFLGRTEPTTVKLNALWGLRYSDLSKDYEELRVRRLLRALLSDSDARVRRETEELLDGPYR